MMTPSQLLVQRAHGMRNKVRQLWCERLESRYAMHAMPWAVEDFSIQPSPVDWAYQGRAVDAPAPNQPSLTLDSVDASFQDQFPLMDDFLDMADGPFAQGEAQDLVIGNLATNGTRPWATAAPTEAENRSPLSPSNSSALVTSIANVVDTRDLTEAFLVRAIGSTSAWTITANWTSSSLIRSSPLGSPVHSSGPFGSVPRVGLLGSIWSTIAQPASSASSVADTASGSSAPTSGNASVQAVPDFNNPASQREGSKVWPTGAYASFRPNPLAPPTTSDTHAGPFSSATEPLDWHGSMSEHAPESTESPAAGSLAAALRSVIEGLAQQRASQRQAAAWHATESGWQEDLASTDASASHRAADHDDGLLTLATLPERMAPTESGQPDAAVDQTRANRLGISLVQVGSIHEFELAGEHLGNVDVILRPDVMPIETRRSAIAASDRWQAETEASRATATNDGENSVLDRILLPLSFLAMGGMLIASQRKYHRLNRPDPTRHR